MMLAPLSAQEAVEAPEATAATDSVDIQLKIRAGVEIAGPAIYLTDKNILNLEAYCSFDLNEVRSIYAGAGFTDYHYSQYNYSFSAKGSFLKAGMDFNLLRPEMAEGRYWAGLGLRYGISRFSYETASFSYENYWGSTTSSVPRQSAWGHFIEASGGFRAELFKNFSIGWMVSARKLIYSGADKHVSPIYFPGYGESGSSFSFAINYFLTWNIPYKKIRVQIKPEPVEEPGDEETEGNDDFSRNVGRQRIGS
ncbi:MAG TPA: DUF6048 family protein [Bacteroidales bacterium]|nr:DUF6048 family protein [Bacteroidales bacterium]